MNRLRSPAPLLLLVFIVTWAGLVGGTFAAATYPTIEDDYGTWYQWLSSQGGNDHWYGLIRAPTTATVAERAAQRWGGHLASFADTNELSFLTQIAKIKFNSMPYRSALVAAPGEMFKWTDGTPFVPDLFSFTNYINNTTCPIRLFFLPFGTVERIADCIGDAGTSMFVEPSLFEITANPSTLPATIIGVNQISGDNFYVENPVINSPGVARFRVSEFGPSPRAIQWKVGGVAIPGATNHQFDLQISTLSTGAVSVAVNNVNGGEESSPIPFQIVPILFTGTVPRAQTTSSNVWWQQWSISQGGNDHWYGIRQLLHEVTYDEAADFAGRVGAELVTLETRAEEQRFLELFSFNFFAAWLGVSKIDSRVFQWVSGAPFTDVNWASAQPDFSDPLATRVVADRYLGWKTARPSDPIGDTLLERTNAPTDIAPFFLSTIPPLHLLVGRTNILQFELVASMPETYQWYRNGDIIPQETNLNLTIEATNVSQTGDYTLVVANGSGCATSAPVAVTVTVPIPITLNVALLESGFLQISWIHPADAETTILEMSTDPESGYVEMSRSVVFGPQRLILSIDNGGAYAPPKFYRVRRSP